MARPGQVHEPGRPQPIEHRPAVLAQNDLGLSRIRDQLDPHLGLERKTRQDVFEEPGLDQCCRCENPHRTVLRHPRRRGQAKGQQGYHMPKGHGAAYAAPDPPVNRTNRRVKWTTP